MKPDKRNFLFILCFSSGMATAQEGLMHQYKFDGNLQDAVDTAHGVVVAGDEAGTEPIFIDGRDGTESGAITFPLPPGPWYMVDVGRWSPSQEGAVGEMTVTFWGFWYGENEGKPQDIINKRDRYSMDEMAWGINQHGHYDNVLSVHHPDRDTRANASKGMPESTWTHVAISFDGSQAYFYLDGVLFDTQNFQYANDFEAMIHIGNSANDGEANIDDVYNGALDDVRFYSRKLTDAEIAGIFNEPTSTLAPPRVDAMLPRHFAGAAVDFIQIKGLTGRTTISVMDLMGRTHLKKDVASNGTLLLRKPVPGMNILKITGPEGADRP